MKLHKSIKKGMTLIGYAASIAKIVEVILNILN